MSMMAYMKHCREKITTTYNYLIRWMKIILHGSTSLKWMEPINDLMFLCTNFTSILTIMMDINHYKVCAPRTFKLDDIDLNLSLSTIVECTYDDCIVVFFSHRREKGKVGWETQEVVMEGANNFAVYGAYTVLKGSSTIELKQGFMDWLVGGCWWVLVYLGVG